MAIRRTRAELAALRVLRIPDNPLHVITPAAVREQMADMDASALNPADDGLPTGGSGGAASFGALGGQPEDNPALEARLRRGPNARPDLLKQVRLMTRAEANANGGGAVFEELDFATCCLFTTVTVEFYRADPAGPWTYGQQLVARYDGSPSPAHQVYRDASFTPGDLVPARFIPVEVARAFTPYASVDGATYLWHTGDYSSAYVAGQTTEQFFLYVGPDGQIAPAPTGTSADAGIWEGKSETDVPRAGIGQVQFDALEGRVEYTEAAIFLHGNRLSALEGGAAMYVAHKSDGTVNSAFTSLRQATDWMGDGGRVFLNRPQGAPVPSNILIGGGSTLDLQGHPLNLGGHDLHLYSGAQVLNNRLIYNGRVFLRDGISPARPQLIQGGVIAAQIYQQTGIAEAVTLDGVLVTNFGQGGAATVGAFTVTLLNGAQFFDYAPDAATTVVTVPARLDPYISAAGAIGSAVVAGAFINGELQGAQPTGSLPGMEFTTTTYGYKYQRGAAGSLVWCRYAKS